MIVKTEGSSAAPAAIIYAAIGEIFVTTARVMFYHVILLVLRFALARIHRPSCAHGFSLALQGQGALRSTSDKFCIVLVIHKGYHSTVGQIRVFCPMGLLDVFI